MSTQNQDADMSPAEIEIMQSLAAGKVVAEQEAAVQAEQGDDESGEVVAEANEAPEGGEAEAPAEEAPAIEATPEPEQPKADAPYQVGDIAAMEAQRKELRNQEAEITDKIQAVRDQWSSGELSDDERDAQIKVLRTEAGELRDRQDEILQEVSAQRALANANAQREQAEQSSILRRIATGAAGVIDYSTPAIATQFDTQLQALSNDATWAAKSFAERAQKAHELVCVLNGKPPTAAPSPSPSPAAAPAPAPAPAARRDVPQTLGNIPAAGAAPVGNDFLAQFEGLSPDDAEAMLERLPKAARENAFRATVRG